MKIHKIEQNTEEWVEFRRGKLGASHAPIIMSDSPWSTPFQLWETLTNRRPPQEQNKWMSRGLELEPIARAKIEEHLGIKFDPICASHDEHEFLIASLDGYNEEHNIALEIKVPGKKDHDIAMSGDIPLKYYAQLQHQLYVSGASSSFYYSFDGKDGVAHQVNPNPEYQAMLLTELLKFWKCLQEDTPPELCDRDFVKIQDSLLEQRLDKWYELSAQKASIEKQLKAITDDIKLAISHPLAKIGSYETMRSTRKGNIDYAAIDALKNIDLEAYRKPSISVFSIKRK